MHLIGLYLVEMAWEQRSFDVYENILFKQKFFHHLGDEVVSVDVSAVGNHS